MNTEELKALAYDLIDQLVASPFDYNDENREDLLTLGAIFGVISAVDAICKICKKEEQE